MAVLDLINLVSKAIDNDMYTLGILMDLSKVFDMDDILLPKMYYYGLQEYRNKWFKNY